MVALVRGVHGLRGAVRVEVLTDRPEDRFAAGRVLYREGDDRPLTIASAEAVADGPGWRLRFREVADARGGRRAARRLSRVGRPARRRARPRRGTTGTRSSASRSAASTAPSSGTVGDVYRVGETEVYVVDGGPYGAFDLPAVRAFIRIFAPRRGEIVVDAEALDLRAPRSRDARPGPAEGAAPPHPRSPDRPATPAGTPAARS